MPTVLRARRLPIVIFISDHPPPHIHVRREGKLAKVRLDLIEFERTGGFNAGERSTILQIVREHQELLLTEWNKLFPSEEMQDDE